MKIPYKRTKWNEKLFPVDDDANYIGGGGSLKYASFIQNWVSGQNEMRIEAKIFHRSWIKKMKSWVIYPSERTLSYSRRAKRFAAAENQLFNCVSAGANRGIKGSFASNENMRLRTIMLLVAWKGNKRRTHSYIFETIKMAIATRGFWGWHGLNGVA